MLTLEDLQAQIDESLAINSIESSYSYDFYTDLINERCGDLEADLVELRAWVNSFRPSGIYYI